MASVSYQIANLLEKMTSNDKDFRFMATNDLMTELQKDSIKLDDDSEKKVVKMLLRLLEDKNGEVQNLAVKCLGPLVNKVKENQVEIIVESLCLNMLSDTEQLRDISSIGLKTVISELPGGANALAANVCKKITGRLSSAIEKQEDVSVQLEALDILADMLSRFGPLLISFHPVLLDALLPQLASSRQAVRKRTIVALSHLVMSCNKALYNKLIEHLLEGLGTTTSPSVSRTHIQCIASICRQAGHRFGEQLVRVAPPVLAHSTDADEELREHSLQALEAFVLKCPKEVTPHIPTIINLCLKMITYDPNYNYEDEEGEGGTGVDGEGADDEDMEQEQQPDATGDSDSEEYSDDDDMSWKVRRAAAKCLESVIATRHELLAEMYTTVSPALIARFKEREENVKCDILSAYTALLRATRPPPALHSSAAPLPPDHPQALLVERVPSVVRGALRVIKGRSARARGQALVLLRELLTAAPACLAAHAAKLIRALTPPLLDKSTASSMKIESLVFTVCLVRGHPAADVRPHVAALLPAMLACVHDPFYKVTAEALRVLQTLVKVVRPLDLPLEPPSPELVKYIPGMYDCTLVRLRATDIDQEVKERAIATMGQLLCHLGDYLEPEMPMCLPIFLERLRNEITRLITVKALTKVAASPLRIDLRPILSDAVPILGSFLRKNQRALKLSTLVLLDTLVLNYSESLSIDLLSKVLQEVPPLISETDLHCAQVALALVRSACETRPDALTPATLLPNILALAKSPLLQGGALKTMLEVFRALVRARVEGCSHKELLSLLVAPVRQVQPNNSLPHLHKQAFHSLAKCVAAVSVEGGDEALEVVRGFLRSVHCGADARDPNQLVSDAQHMFALLAVAEIGKRLDLSVIPHLEDVLLSSFAPSPEEVRSAASYALGSVAVGNLPKFLPFILREIEAQPKRQYLLLHSLKEIISCESCSTEGVEALRPFIPSIWVKLANHCQCSEEGSRNVVSECLGKLCLLEPADLLPHLRAFLKSPEPLTRTTAVTALKFTISDQPQAIDPLLRECMAEFLWTLRDPELGVRRVALVAFNSAAHNKPSLIRDLLPDVLPQLYEETKVKKELIREVEMGPFKHSVDDGLDLRKAAFECMYTLLGTCLDRLDVFTFLRHLEGGLRDHYDIKMLTYLMCARLAQLCPTIVLQRVESLVEPLRVTCTTKVKANSVKQEYEKQDELKRSALRAAAALLNIPEADKNPHLMDFVTQIKSFPDLQPIFENILKDASGTVASDSNLMDQS